MGLVGRSFILRVSGTLFRAPRTTVSHIIILALTAQKIIITCSHFLIPPSILSCFEGVGEWRAGWCFNIERQVDVRLKAGVGM